MLKNSVVAMGIGAKIVENAAVEIVNSIKTKTGIPNAFASFEKHFKIKMSGADTNKYVGLILVDGLRCAEERLMEKIDDLTDVTLMADQQETICFQTNVRLCKRQVMFERHRPRIVETQEGIRCHKDAGFLCNKPAGVFLICPGICS